MEETYKRSSVNCNPHPDAPHGFLKDASNSEGRYVCQCEFWAGPNRRLTKEDIVRMAREVGIPTGRIGGYDKELKRFADLVVAAVAEPVQQEPVAWANSFDLQNFDMKVRTCPDLHHTVPLYTAPPKQWVGLTDEEINSVCYKRDWTAPWTNTTFARAIEEKLKEKNT